MLTTLQLITLLLIAVTMACTVGHALELPGKARLTKEIYLAVQPIYYPGFTIVGGFAEIGALLLSFVLLFVTSQATAAFALTLGACIALVVLEAIFWIFTQPVNKFWLADQELGRAGKAFFGTAHRTEAEPEWTTLRNRWEYSHVARAVMATAALMLLATAIALS